MRSAFPKQKAELGDGEGFAYCAKGRGNRTGLIKSHHGAKAEGEERGRAAVFLVERSNSKMEEEAMLTSLVAHHFALSEKHRVSRKGGKNRADAPAASGAEKSVFLPRRAHLFYCTLML